MARVRIDGMSLYSEIECVKTLDGWEPEVPSELEFEVDVDDIEFTTSDLRKIVREYLDKILDILIAEHPRELVNASIEASVELEEEEEEE